MTIDELIESLDFFTELAGVAVQYDTKLAGAIAAHFERRHVPRERTLTAEAAKKGPKNLLTAAASVQDCAA